MCMQRCPLPDYMLCSVLRGARVCDRGTSSDPIFLDDCTDRSVDILATLRPLERSSKRLSSVRRSPSNQGLDIVDY